MTLAAVGSLQAQTLWVGTTNSYGTAANWSPTTTPGGSIIALFDDTANVTDGVTLGGNNRPVLGLSFNNDTKTYRFTRVEGSQFTLGVEGITKAGSGTVNFQTLVVMGGNRTFDLQAGVTQFERIIGGFTLTKTGEGTMEFYGTASYANSINNFIIREGTVNLRKTAGISNYNGTLAIGSASGSDLAGTVILNTQTSNQLSGTSVSIYNAGILNVGDTSQTVHGSLNLYGGDVSIGESGNLTLNADLGNSSSTMNRVSTIGLTGTGTVTFNAAATFLNITNQIEGTDMRIDAIIAGSNTLRKVSAGTLTYGGTQSNTHSGLMQVEGGVLELARTGGGTAVAGNLNVQSTATSIGTLLLGGSDQVADTSEITLQGGNFDLNGFSETVAALSIISGEAAQTTSYLDFGSGSADFRLTTEATYSSGALTVLNWDGDLDGNGANRWLFEFDPTGFVSSIGDNLFFDGFGSGGKVIDLGAGLWEVVVVPEPSTVALLIGISFIFTLRIRRMRIHHV